MATLMGWVAGLLVFGVWMSIVGNPHVVETAIGLALGIGAGWWMYRFVKRVISRFARKKEAT